MSVHLKSCLNIFPWLERQCYALALGLIFSLFSCAAYANWVDLAQVGMAVRSMADAPQSIALARQARVLAVALEDYEGLVWFNPDTGAELGRIKLDEMPIAIALNASGDIAYLLLEDSEKLHVLSLAQKVVLNKWTVGEEPTAISLSADGQQLVVADRESRRLVAYDPVTGQRLRTLQLDKAPVQIAHSQQVGGAARLLVAASGGLLLTLDAANWSELSRVTVGDDIRALGVWDGGGMALAVGKHQDALNIIDPSTGVIASRIPLDGDPDRLAIDGIDNRAYVTTKDDLSVNRVDLNGGALQGRYPIPDRAGGIVFDAHAKVLFLSQPRGERLLRLDPEKASMVFALTLQRRLKDLTINNVTHQMIAIADEADEMARLDLVTKQGQSIKLPGAPRRIGVDPVLNRAVIGIAHGKHEVIFADLAPSTPTIYPERLDLQEEIIALAVDPVRKRTVVLAKGRRVAVLDNATRTLLGITKGASSYLGVAIHSGTGKAYLLTSNAELQKFDPVTRSIEQTWKLNFDGQNVAVDESRNLVLISSDRGRKVHLFDLTTGAIAQSFEFAKQPGQIAVQADIALAVIVSKESGKIGTLDLTTNIANTDFASIEKPHAVAVSTRFNQAFVLTSEHDEVDIISLPNPTPVLDAVTPAQLSAGGATVTLTLDGSKFIDGSIVLADGVALATKWISGQKLEATVPASLIALAKEIRISVKTNAPAGGESSSIKLIVAGSNPILNGFNPAQLFANGQPQNLTLLGQSFKAGAVVQIGAQTLVPNIVLPTQITVQLPGTLLVQSDVLPITVKNSDGLMSSVLSLPVVPVSVAPVIETISPVRGAVGTQITINGSNFATAAQNNQITFAGDANNAAIRVNAVVASASNTQLTAIVPQNAVTGTVNLGTPSGNTIGPVFTVQQDLDVSFSATPANTTVYQGASTNISLHLSNAGAKEYNGLMQLVVTGVPAGVIAKLSPSYLSKGQNGTLVLTAASTAAVTASPVVVTITATDTIGLGIVRTSSFRLNVAASAGVSGIKGRFVTPDGAGIGSVRVAYQDASGNLVSQVQSDSAGTFMLTGLPTGAITLRMDATPAHPLYPIWPYSMDNPGNGLVNLADWVINPPPSAEKFVEISNITQDQAVTDERYPGLAITLPAGVNIIGWDGVKKTRIAVERITPDKLPVPTPPFPMKEAYQLYFGTPMGGIPSAPIPITLPNVAESDPGEILDIWFFDGSPMGGTGEWKIAGQGEVTIDGKSVAMLPGQGLTRFCGVCGLFSLSCPEPPKPPPCNDDCNNKGGPKPPKGGNPVDLLTGQEAPKNVGLSVGGLNPIDVRMNYNPVDAFDGRAGTFASFGLGWTLNYDVVLVVNGVQARLFMPGGNTKDFQNAGGNIYTAPGDPHYEGARITALDVNANLWQLKHADGRIWKFGPFPGITGVIRGGPPLFVTEMVDTHGNATHISRQGNGRINAVGSGSRTVTFNYGGNGFVSGIQDSAERSMQFTYNTKNRVETVTDADNKTTRYTYVDDNEIPPAAVCGIQASRGERIKTITYPGKPNPTENHYGVGKRVLRQVAMDGRESLFSYKLTGACVTNVNNPGAICTGANCPTEDNWANHQAGWRVHGGQVFATAVTNPDGTTESWRFAADRTPVEYTDSTGQATTYKYDSARRMIEQKDALGRVTRHQYDATGNRKRTIDPLQRITDFSYDSKWNTVTRTTRYNDATPLGLSNPQSQSAQYDPDTGVVTSMTTPLNHVTRMEYTASGLLRKITTAGNAVTEFDYTATGDVQKITEKVTDTSSRNTEFTVDEVGRTVQTTDPLGYSSSVEYNGSDQVTESTDALLGKTKLGYDSVGRLATVTNPLNHTIQTNSYDDGDRLKTQANALGQTAHNQYDSSGRLQSSTDPAGRITTYGYDATGRLSGITRPEGMQSLSYDLAGRLIRVADSISTLEYEYDAVDRVTRHTQKSGTRISTLDYQYDSLDRLTQRVLRSTDTSGERSIASDTTEYQYDAKSRLTQITWKGDGSQNQTTQYSWTDDDYVQQKTLPNGIKVSYGYDLINQLKQMEYTSNTGSSNVVIDRIQYRYDDKGQIVQRDSLNNISKDETPYTAIYNTANQLTDLTLSPGTANQQIYKLTYDPAGNLTQKQNAANPSEQTHYQWDSRNRLTQITAPGIVASFQYDVSGRRIGKSANGQVTSYLYDGAQAIGEIRQNDISINLTGLGLDEAIARYTQTGSGAVTGATAITDLLGSVIAQANADQTIQNRYAYSPYGETEASVTDNNPTQYTARENDGTGLYFYRARYYDPQLKRFLASDPIGLDGGTNMYAYVKGNPLSLVDPKGLNGDPPDQSGAGVPPPPYPNGNYEPGFTPQDGVCTVSGWAGDKMNSDPCILGCCQKHDDCYTKNGCNASSWDSNRGGYKNACQQCNAEAVNCIAKAMKNGCSSCN